MHFGAIDSGMELDSFSNKKTLGILDLFSRHASGEKSKELYLDAKRFCETNDLPEILESNFSLTPYGRKLWPRLHEATAALSATAALMMSEGESASGAVFVVGSAHFDIVATYDIEQAKYRDKVGRLSFSVGGTGFHVSSELAKHGQNVALATFLNGNSLTSDSIFNAIRDAGIETSFIQFYQGPEESAFVAHVCGEEMVSAVSHMHIETCQFATDMLVKGVASSSAVVADANLSPAQIATLAEICSVYARPLFLAAVSESKMSRIADARMPSFLVSMNESEFVSSAFSMDTPEQISESCKRLQCRVLSVTRGSSGYCLLGAEGWKLSFVAPEAATIVSTNGAGDALLAGLISYFLRHSTGNAGGDEQAFWGGCEKTVADFVVPCMAARAALLTPFIQAMLPVHDELPAAERKRGFWSFKK